MLSCSAISKQYHKGARVVEAIVDVSISIPQGEFVAIIGPSGCGKSTLLKIIGDIVEPSSGEVRVDGMSACEARRHRAYSFVFQNPVLMPWRTVIENAELPQEIIGSVDRSKTRQLLALTGLDKFEDMYPAELSGGMQQRVGIVRALSQDPKILLLDEPFGALDDFTRRSLNAELLKIWEQNRVTIVLVTHSISEALYMADRVIVLSKRPGRVKTIHKVDFARPRDEALKEAADFQGQVRWLREQLN